MFFISNLLFAQTPFLVPNTLSTVKTVNVANDIYYFRIIDSSGSNVQQLWKMNASSYATSKVKSFGALFSPYGEVSLATAVNNKMYFVIYISPGDQQLWVSDGTEAGTKPLFMASKIYAFFDFNNELIFSAYSYTNTTINGMYKSNGTALGTMLLKNIQSRYNGTFVDEGIYNYTKYKNKIVFTVHKGVNNNPTTHYAELWSTDGTSNGFVRLDSINGSLSAYGKKLPYPDFSNKFPEFNSLLFFTFVNKATNNTAEIWGTNGNVNSSTYFYDLGISANTSPVIPFNNKLIFTAFTSNYGQELYTTDGTIPNTSLLKNINSSPSFLSSNPYNFVEHCNKLFFIATDSSNVYKGSGKQMPQLLAQKFLNRREAFIH
jgi:ELWxxDGT repeat protein